jgi:hypothetical protein
VLQHIARKHSPFVARRTASGTEIASTRPTREKKIFPFLLLLHGYGLGDRLRAAAREANAQTINDRPCLPAPDDLPIQKTPYLPGPNGS